MPQPIPDLGGNGVLQTTRLPSAECGSSKPLEIGTVPQMSMTNGWPEVCRSDLQGAQKLVTHEKWELADLLDSKN